MTDDQLIRRHARIALFCAIVLLVFAVALDLIFLVAVISICIGAAAVLGFIR